MLDTGEVGEGPVVESSVELAVHKAAGRVEDFPGPAVSSDAAVAFATRAGVAREAEEIAVNFTEEDEIFYLKQKKLLINLPEELKSGRSRVCVSSRSRRNC